MNKPRDRNELMVELIRLLSKNGIEIDFDLYQEIQYYLRRDPRSLPPTSGGETW